MSLRFPHSPTSEMASKLSTLEVVLRASSRLKRPFELPLSVQCFSMSHYYVGPYLGVDTDVIKSTCLFQSSVSSVNQTQASPSTSAPQSRPDGAPDPSKPSPAQLSFILDKLREEVRYTYTQTF